MHTRLWNGLADRPTGGRLVPVAFTGGAPLGLRYTLLKLVDGRMVEVSPDSVFRAGDRIQVAVEANDAGYLYIVHQGSSGTWKPMFPSAEIEDGNNRVEKGRELRHAARNRGSISTSRPGRRRCSSCSRASPSRTWRR